MKLDPRIERMALIAVLALLAVGCVVVLLPFISALLWAVILTYSTWPIYQWTEAKVGGRKNVASGLMTLLLACLLIVPFVALGTSLADNVRAGVGMVISVLEDGPPGPPAWIVDLPLLGPMIFGTWEGMANDGGKVTAALAPYLGSIQEVLIAGGLSLGGGVLQLVLSVVIAFFFFRDGTLVAEHAGVLIDRVAGHGARRLLVVAGNTVKGVVYGIIGTALAQGLLAAIGLVVTGVPGALFLGVVTAFLSIIPVGPPFVWVSATLWLFYEGHLGAGVFMGLWGMFVVSGIDNILKPWLISRGSKLPLVLVFLGIAGGVLAFGVLGIFIGPTLLALAYTLIVEWGAQSTQPEVVERAAAE